MIKFILTLQVKNGKIGKPILEDPSEATIHLSKLCNGFAKDFVIRRVNALDDKTYNVLVKYRDTKKGCLWEMKILN